MCSWARPVAGPVNSSSTTCETVAGLLQGPPPGLPPRPPPAVSPRCPPGLAGLSQDGADRGMAGQRQAILHLGAVHDAAYRLAPEPLSKSIQFGDQGGEHLIGCNRSTATKCSATRILPNAGSGSTRSRTDPLGKSWLSRRATMIPDRPPRRLPSRRWRNAASGQAQPGNSLPDKGIDGSDLLARQWFDGERRHSGSPGFGPPTWPTNGGGTLISDQSVDPGVGGYKILSLGQVRLGPGFASPPGPGDVRVRGHAALRMR